jgi:malate dehydrogenase
MQRSKIAVIGAGNVGGASAAAIAGRRLGNVYLHDVVEGLAVGKAMDINQASAFFHTDSPVVGWDSLDFLPATDIVVISAGAPRRTGMTRRDLLRENLGAVSGIAERIMSDCPQAKVLLVTNPADILTWIVKERWPGMHVFGLGCTLDTVRLRYFLAEAAGVSIDSVSALVIGSHDDNMLPLVKHATIGGARACEVLSAEQIERAVRLTRGAGHTIVARLKSRGSFYAASHCIAEVVEAIVRDTHAVFPLSVRCDGPYALSDVCLALPCRVGITGVEGIIEIALDDEDRAALGRCLGGIQEGVRSAG